MVKCCICYFWIGSMNQCDLKEVDMDKAQKSFDSLLH